MKDDIWKLVEKALLETMDERVKSAGLELDSRFAEDLKLGSLRTVELIIQLEDAFDITIADDELASLVTVRDLVDLIDGKMVEA